MVCILCVCVWCNELVCVICTVFVVCGEHGVCSLCVWYVWCMLYVLCVGTVVEGVHVHVCVDVHMCSRQVL